MNDVKITCDECGNAFGIKELNEKTVENVKIDGKTFTITYFKCAKCGKLYLVEMLDYRAEKLKNKYLSILNSVNKKKAQGARISNERLKELESAKSEAVEYQKYLADNYSDRIPSTICD